MQILERIQCLLTRAFTDPVRASVVSVTNKISKSF